MSTEQKYAAKSELFVSEGNKLNIMFLLSISPKERDFIDRVSMDMKKACSLVCHERITSADILKMYYMCIIIIANSLIRILKGTGHVWELSKGKTILSTWFILI